MRFILFLLCTFFSIISWGSNNNLSVMVTGLSKEEKQIVLANLSIKTAEKITPSKSRIESFYKLGFEEITTTLESLGYYHPNIEGELLVSEQGYTCCRLAFFRANR